MANPATLTLKAILLVLLIAPAAAAQVAVLEFETTTGDKAFDWIGAGIAETLSTELGRLPEFTLVERSRLNDVLKQIQASRSQAFDPATAQRVGKLIGARTIVVGSFQKSGDRLRLTARFVEVETGVIRTPVLVEGAYRDIFALQTQLAAKLAGAELETVTRANSLAALEAFSDGVYFYRNDMIPDALTQLNRALTLDPTAGGAHFYRGLSLGKLERWDEAIEAFKRALPRVQPRRRETWTWTAPFKEDRSRRGIVAGIDTAEVSLQAGVLNRAGQAGAQKRVIYAERTGANTVLHFVDFEQRNARRLEIPDDKILLNDVVLATGRLTVLLSTDASALRMPQSLRLYGIGAADGARWWSERLSDIGPQLPMIGAVSDLVYLYFPDIDRMAAFNDRTAQLQWTRDGLGMDRLESPKARTTRQHGPVMVLKSGSSLRAVRLRDGQDAWATETGDARFTHIVTGDSAIIFEPDRRVRIADLETGNTRIEIPVAQFKDNLRLGPLGSAVLVGAAVEGDTLYFVSRSLDMYAIDLRPGERWRAPFKRRIRSLREVDGRVYAAADTGELIVLDAASGAVRASVKVAPKDLALDYIGGGVVIASAEKAVYGLDPETGAKRWEYPAPFSPRGVVYLKGVVTLRTSERDLSALDAETGALLWRHSGARAPGMFMTEESFFIVEENGVKEYAIDPPASVESGQRIREREVLTELAAALVSKGDLAQAAAYAGRAPDYPPMRAVRARLERSKGNAGGAARELAAAGAIEELKRGHGLLWYERLDAGAAGDPQLIGDRLVSVGRSLRGQNQIVALDPATGATIWRQSPERFSDVAIDRPSERAWYIGGEAEDPAGVILYSLSIQTGERKELARWKGPGAVSIAAIAAARERVFVLTASPDAGAGKIFLRVRAFTAEGVPLWDRTHEQAVNSIQIQTPVGLFAPVGDYLAYSMGPELWTVSGGDGAVANRHREETGIAPRFLPNEVGGLYFVNGNAEVVRYDPAAGSVVSRAPMPANALPGLEGPVEINGGPVSGRLIESVDRLFLLGGDGVVAEIDRSSGSILRHLPALWPPSGIHIAAGRLYAFTSDRAAYAIQLPD